MSELTDYERLTLNTLEIPSLNGRTVYEYYTSDSHQYSFHDDGTTVKIIDRTGALGRQKRVSTELQDDDETKVKLNKRKYYPVKVDDINIAFSTDLVNSKRQYIHDGSYQSLSTQKSKPLGLIEERFKSHYEKYDEDGDKTGHNDKKYKQTVRDISYVMDNVFITGTSQTFYAYPVNHDDGTFNYALGRKVTKGTENIQWNANNGQVSATETRDNYNRRVVTEVTYAYEKYPEFKEKNMLKQQAGETSYLLDHSDDFHSLASSNRSALKVELCI